MATTADCSRHRLSVIVYEKDIFLQAARSLVRYFELYIRVSTCKSRGTIDCFQTCRLQVQPLHLSYNPYSQLFTNGCNLLYAYMYVRFFTRRRCSTFLAVALPTAGGASTHSLPVRSISLNPPGTIVVFQQRVGIPKQGQRDMANFELGATGWPQRVVTHLQFILEILQKWR